MQIPTFKDKLHLVDLGLARVSKNKNLWTFKYKSDVMYKNKWKDLHPIAQQQICEAINAIRNIVNTGSI